MFKFIKKIHWKKVFIAALAYLIIASVLRQLEVLFTFNYYLMPQYFGVWSKLMMPTVGPPPQEFMFISLFFTFLTGVVLAAFFDFIKTLLPKDFWGKVIYFTKITVALMLVFGYLPLYLLINLPLVLIISWFVSGSISVFLGAIVFAKLIR